MAISDISLTAGMRGNLLQLQGTAYHIDRTQERLSTGRRVNSALDSPTNFFASQAANYRAADLNGCKDSVKEAIQNITAANNGITAISALLSAANGLAEAALGTNVQADRDTFSKQFDEILNQIDSLATDSSYRGTNLLKSDSLTVNFSESGGASTLSIAGVDATSSGLGVSKTSSGGPPVGTITDTWTYDQTYTGGGFPTRYDTSGLTSFKINGESINYTIDGPGHVSYTSRTDGVGTQAVFTFSPGTGPSGMSLDPTYWSAVVSTGSSATNPWTSTANIQTSMDQIKTATDTMRSNAKSLASNSNILSTRLDYTSSMVNILQTGADKLTLADMNEEGANMLMLQTRQSLGTTSLSMAAQAAQSVMRLF